MMQRVLLLPERARFARLHAAAAGRRSGLDRIAARHAVLCGAFRRGRKAGPGEDQVAIVLQLACVSLHGARHEHDGLCDQRGQLRPHRLRLRAIGDSHGAVDPDRAGEGQGNHALARAAAMTARKACSACRATVRTCARAGASACADVCPTAAIKRGPTDAACDIDYGRCVVCQLCTEACPTGADEPSRLGVRRTPVATICVWAKEHRRTAPDRIRQAQRLPPQPACPPRRCRLLQRLRVRTAGAEQSLLQPASARDLLHALAALCRSAAGHRPGHPTRWRSRCARPMTLCQSPLGDGRWHLRRVRRHRRGRLCLRQRPRRRAPVDVYLPGCPPNPAAIIEALLMFLDRAPQRVRGRTHWPMLSWQEPRCCGSPRRPRAVRALGLGRHGYCSPRPRSAASSPPSAAFPTGTTATPFPLRMADARALPA